MTANYACRDRLSSLQPILANPSCGGIMLAGYLVEEASGMLVASIAIVAVLVVLGIVAGVMVWKRRKAMKPAETKYRIVFVLGAILFLVGIACIIAFFFRDISLAIGIPPFIIGIAYLATGWANRDKWKPRV